MLCVTNSLRTHFGLHQLPALPQPSNIIQRTSHSLTTSLYLLHKSPNTPTTGSRPHTVVPPSAVRGPAPGARSARPPARRPPRRHARRGRRPAQRRSSSAAGRCGAWRPGPRTGGSPGGGQRSAGGARGRIKGAGVYKYACGLRIIR